MPTNPLRCYSPDLSILTHIKPTRPHSPHPSSTSRPSSPFILPHDLLAMSFLPPSKPSCHPLILVNTTQPLDSHPLLAVTSSASYATPPISPAAESPLEKDSTTELPILAPLAHRPSRATNNVSAITIQPYINQTRLGGIFIREDDASKLGLKRIGEAETYYGICPRYTPVTAVIFNHRRLIQNVYALPRAFEGTKYHDGVTGVDTLLDLGFSVGVDRGMVYLTDPEWSEYGGAGGMGDY